MKEAKKEIRCPECEGSVWVALDGPRQLPKRGGTLDVRLQFGLRGEMKVTTSEFLPRGTWYEGKTRSRTSRLKMISGNLTCPQ